MTQTEVARRIDGVLEAASRAPSSHNSQPWIFQVVGERILLVADRTRALPVNDPEDRELTISCGAALMNLLIAARGVGLTPSVRVLPDADRPDVLADVHLAPAGHIENDAVVLSAAIPRRRTHRERFEDRAVDPATVEALVAAVRQEGAWLTAVTGTSEKHAIADLVAEGDAEHWGNASWRRELSAWMHPRRAGDGLAVAGALSPLAQAVVRTFDMGDGVAARDEAIADGSPLIVVLSTKGDAPSDWLTAGQALEHLLLVACRDGLQASYLNQPVQLSVLREQLRTCLQLPGVPQQVLRLGYPRTTLPPTARRPLAAMVERFALA